MKVAVLVAHPDDETLWAGGTILTNPEWEVFVGVLCRGGDPDRAPKFFRALEALGADGAIADLDDGPEQAPLDPAEVGETILSLLPQSTFDLLLTHGPRGEYTRHRRHEEVCRAALALWDRGLLSAPEFRPFAFEDGSREYLPRPPIDAPLKIRLPDDVWARKYRIVTEVYGFAPDSWEARATPREEGFWSFTHAAEAIAWARSLEIP
jgi:LmbE family N-acetylglucosaminyl deacetylase